MKKSCSLPDTAGKRSSVRWFVVSMLFLVTSINYADRATLSIVGDSVQHELGLSSVAMGYVFSAFGWAYVVGQIPGGWLLDRFGSKIVIAASIFFWSLFTLLQGALGFSPRNGRNPLFALRFLVGLSEAPSFPATAGWWLPGFQVLNAEQLRRSSTRRSTSHSSFFTADGVARPLFQLAYGFVIMGALGIAMSFIWLKTIYEPKNTRE